MLLFTGTIHLPSQSFFLPSPTHIKSINRFNFGRKKSFSSSRRVTLITAMDPFQYSIDSDGDRLYSPKAGELYFSYGSNMSRKKMKSRSITDEPINFQNVWIGHLRDWELCFDLRGALPNEPAMGSIIPRKGAEVYGLVYEISTEKCWQMLLRTEGITDRKRFYSSYDIIEVELECYNADTPEIKTKKKVRTLISGEYYRIKQELQPYVLPSRRYVDLLIHGATEERMPAHYINKLKELPCARPWDDGILKKLMRMCIALVFFAKRKEISFLVHGLNCTNIHFYGNYERLARSKTKNLQVRFWMNMYFVGLFIVYAIYVIPSLIFTFGTPQGRKFHKAIKKVLKAKQEEAKKSSGAVETKSESTVTSS